MIQVQRQANVFQAVKVAFKNEFVKKEAFSSQSFFEQKLTLALSVIRYIGIMKTLTLFNIDMDGGWHTHKI